MTPQRTSPASFLKLSADVATFYGFSPAKSSTLTNMAALNAPQILGAEPTLAFYVGSSPAHVPPGQSAKEVAEFGLSVVGSTESVGEVVLLKTLTTIIGEWGGTVARVRVNALGDKDSKMRFARELSVYLRKHAPELDA